MIGALRVCVHRFRLAILAPDVLLIAIIAAQARVSDFPLWHPFLQAEATSSSWFGAARAMVDFVAPPSPATGVWQQSGSQ